MHRNAIGALLLVVSQTAAASEYRIERIEPAGRVIVYIVEPLSKRRFQASVGAIVGPTETITLGAPIARVDVVDLQTGRRSQISSTQPMRAPAAGAWDQLKTRLADLGRLSANMGATQSSASCAGRKDFGVPDVPILAEGPAMLVRGPRRLVLPLRLPAGTTTRLELIDPAGRSIVANDVREPWWQGPVPAALTPGVYGLRLTSASGTSVERSLQVTDNIPPAAPAGAGGTADPAVLEAVRLATVDDGRWRLSALSTALAVPKAARPPELNQLIQLLGEGVRLHDPQAVAACLDPPA